MIGRDVRHRALIRIIRARSLAPGDAIVTLDLVERKQGGRVEMVKRWIVWTIKSMDTFGSAVVLHLHRNGFEGKVKNKLMVTPPDSYQKRHSNEAGEVPFDPHREFFRNRPATTRRQPGATIALLTT